MRRDRQDRHALRLHPADLQEPEGPRVARPRHLHRGDEPRVLALAQHLLDRPRAARPREHHPRAERQQRRGEVAIGMRREQVAPHRRHVAHLRPADHPRHRVEEVEIAARQHIGHRHPRAEAHVVPRGTDLAQRRIGAAQHDPRGRGPGVHLAHHDGAAAEIDRVPPQRPGGLGQRRIGLDHRHASSSPICARTASNPL
jgi:hypothetical protein